MMEKKPPAGNLAPLVVKLGGSLIAHVPDLVPVFFKSPRPLVIVPGGSVFADAVRKTRTDDLAAHWMAIAAMDQYGWYIVSKGMSPTHRLEIPKETVVFLPYCTLRGCDPLPHSWAVTSDSIAAWVADKLGLGLLVLKSVDGIMKNDLLLEVVDSPLETQTVDPFFLPFVLENKVRTHVINGTNRDRVEKFLTGEKVPGTGICTTF